MYYELMRTDTHNLYGEYDSLDEAYVAVREAVGLAGEGVVYDLMLSRMQDDGDGELIATGSRLLSQAFQIAHV